MYNVNRLFPEGPLQLRVLCCPGNIIIIICNGVFCDNFSFHAKCLHNV